MKKNVVIGMLGTNLDRCEHESRWDTWRPSVSVCQHKNLNIARFELLCTPNFNKLAKIVSDDINVVSNHTKVNINNLSFKNPWDFEDVYGALYDFTRNYKFDIAKEDYLVHITTGTHVAQICFFLLAESRLIPGKLLQTIPPQQKCVGTAGSFKIIDLDLSKYDKLASRFFKKSTNDVSFLKSGIDTKNKKFNNLIEMIERVAINSTEPILLMGPTGSGKSQLAKRIYELKKSRHHLSGLFVEVNCATLRGDTAMSALFGHVKGAFTGATQPRSGLLKEADNGLLFLDEVGELGIDEQTMLLRAIEEKSYMPFGSDKTISSNFQLICGTNHDLIAEAAKGIFRDDLLSRINLWTFDLPGLKDRREDIEPNIQFELNEVTRKTGSHISFNREAMDLFLNFAVSDEATWKANFRDLKGAITRMTTLASGGRVSKDIVEMEIEKLKFFWNVSTKPDFHCHMSDEVFIDDRLVSLIGRIDPFDVVQLSYVIKICKQSSTISEAGRELFSVTRDRKKHKNDTDRLRKYLLSFNLSWDDVRKR
ncbi:MAG TPA: RNA repair transcriptional activator RtcR [bacterium]|nr:RNA repair transcriptional activator RtcR [bacterium]